LRLAALLVFATLAASSSALTTSAMGFATIHARLDYEITVPAAADQVVFLTYLFKNTTSQNATCTTSDAYSASMDDYGNAVASFTYSPAAGTEKDVWIDCTVNESYDPSVYAFEGSQGNAVDYLSPSKLVKIDSQITALAGQITSNSTDEYEETASLASWVYKNIVYDSKYKDMALDSVTVLDIGRGTCDEKAHLLEAFLRARGIPARHVVGFAYSGTDWQPHAWVEALINGTWIGVDPTFEEMFYLDATHLRLAVGRDQDDTKYTIRATGTDNLSGTGIAAGTNFTIQSSAPYSKFFSIRAGFPTRTYSASEVASIDATVENLLPDRMIAVPISLSLYSEFSMISDASQIVLVQPKKAAAVSWEFVFPPQITGGYSYNYSSIVSAYGNETTGYLSASQNGTAAATKTAVVENFAADKQADGILLYFWVRNTGSSSLEDTLLTLDTVGATTKKTIAYLAVGESDRIEFLVPYSQAPDPNALEANLTVTTADSKNKYELQVNLAEPAATGTPGSGNGLANAIILVFSTPVFLAGAAIVIVLTLLISIILRKKRYIRKRR
jgi:transglutaminase-like putative cysteine protease